MNKYTIIYERKFPASTDQLQVTSSEWNTYTASTTANSVYQALSNTVLHRESKTLRVISVFCTAFEDDWN